MPEFRNRYSATIYRYCKTCEKGYSKRLLEQAYWEEVGEHQFGEEIQVCPVCRSDWAEPRIQEKGNKNESELG